MSTRRPSSAEPGCTRRRQRGAASLVVVLVLFLVVSLVAAYTSRNLIFEQRTGINQYRSTQALEAAEAGLEWTIQMLNAGLIDNACAPDASAARSFRQRYLIIDGDSGMIAPIATFTGDRGFAICVLDGGEWSCNCPESGTPTVPTPTEAGQHPAFAVSFTRSPTQPGVVRAHVNGCTVADTSCLRFSPTMGAGGEPVSQAVAPGNEGVAAISAWLGHVAHLPAIEREPAPTRAVTTVLPRDAVTVQGSVLPPSGAAKLDVVRAGAGPGFAARAGGAIDPDAIAPTAQPGTPAAAATLSGDAALAALDTDAAGAPAGDRMFASVFNVLPETFKQQPATVQMSCSPCSAAQLRDRVLQNPGRPIWIDGSLAIDQALEIGSDDWPALVVVTGDVAFSNSGATLRGLLYGRASTWTVSGAPEIRGALVAENDLQLSVSGGRVVYDQTILTRLSTRVGSFVRVPGGWKDFP